MFRRNDFLESPCCSCTMKLHVTSDKAERPLGCCTPSISLTVLLIYYTWRSWSWEMNGAPHGSEGSMLVHACERVFVQLWLNCEQVNCSAMMQTNSFLSTFSFFLFFSPSRPCKARSPLCHMSESRHKDCKPRKAQRISVNEGKISFFLWEISDLHPQTVCSFLKKKIHSN